MKATTTKKFLATVLLCTMAFVCHGQGSFSGKWYLREVQIPSNEEFSDLTNYDKDSCIVLTDINANTHSGVNFMASEEEIDAFLEEFKRLIEDSTSLVAVEETITENCEKYYYEIVNDTVLIFKQSVGNGVYDRRYRVSDIYLIKQKTDDRLLLALGRTMHGEMRFVYSRTKQPIKHTHHNTARPSYPNPTVSRLSTKEISASLTPAAVAYNFVNAILNSNPSKMLSYMDNETAANFEKSRMRDGYSNYDPYFSAKGNKLNILGWKDFLPNKCEVAVLYVQSEWFDNDGWEIKKVYVGCVPSAEVGHSGFQDITTYGGTNVKVLVANSNGTWKVIGFK